MLPMSSTVPFPRAPWRILHCKGLISAGTDECLNNSSILHIPEEIKWHVLKRLKADFLISPYAWNALLQTRLRRLSVANAVAEISGPRLKRAGSSELGIGRAKQRQGTGPLFYYSYLAKGSETVGAAEIISLKFRKMKAIRLRSVHTVHTCVWTQRNLFDSLLRKYGTERKLFIVFHFANTCSETRFFIFLRYGDVRHPSRNILGHG